jgi:hypothetical protein
VRHEMDHSLLRFTVATGECHVKQGMAAIIRKCQFLADGGGIGDNLWFPCEQEVSPFLKLTSEVGDKLISLFNGGEALGLNIAFRRKRTIIGGSEREKPPQMC